METISREQIITVSADSVKAEDAFLIIKYNGKDYRFAWSSLSEKLAKATLQQRANFTVSPSGYGIHWHELDEDISVCALLQTLH